MSTPKFSVSIANGRYAGIPSDNNSDRRRRGLLLHREFIQQVALAEWLTIVLIGLARADSVCTSQGARYRIGAPRYDCHLPKASGLVRQAPGVDQIVDRLRA